MKPTSSPPSVPLFSESYKWYVLLILTGVYVFNFVDRQIVVILQEPIKTELGLADWQLGLMSGFVFAIFYVTLGIPIARLADTKNRKNIIAVCLTIWSAMTAVTGQVQNFTQMLLARMGVGIGEAGGSPPAHSIISDYFSPQKRATALSVYSAGLYIGLILGYLLGGWIAQKYGWRMAFYVLGIPGILYAVLLYFTVKEPPRGYSENTTTVSDSQSVWEVLKFLRSRKSFLYIAFACGLHSFVGYGTSNWMPSFLIRIHGMEIADVGFTLAIVIGFFGAVGTFLGGFLCDLLGKRDRRWYMWLPALSIFLAIPFGLFTFFSNDTNLALAVYVIPNILFAIYLGPAIAITHGIVSPKMRAMASAILFFILNLIGLGLGPFFAGILSDYLNPTFGSETLRWVLAIVSAVDLIAIYLFYKAAQHIEADLDAAPE